VRQTMADAQQATTESPGDDASPKSLSGPDRESKPHLKLKQLSRDMSAEMRKQEEEKYAPLKTEEEQRAQKETIEAIGTMRSLIWNESAFDLAEAKKYRVTGSFQENWREYLNQPYYMKTVKNHEDKEEELCFAEPLAPRRIFVALKVKRISDIDNVAETYRCRFHIYFDWLLTEHDYKSYCEYHTRTAKVNKKMEWIPPFRPRYEFLNIVQAYQMDEVDYGTEGQYRVQRLKDFETKLVGFDSTKAWMCRMKLEVDATFCEELELENFPVDCQDFSIVMRESWGSKRAIFVPEMRTRKGVPSDFARVDPSFSVLDEWDFHNSRVEFRTSNPSESRSDSKYHMLTIRFKMRRKYTVYLFNFVLYMFFIALLSMCCFALNAEEIIGERMALAVTLLLTAVAFQDIVFEELPNVAYMTLLHEYILASFVFIACVVVQTAILATGADDGEENVFGDTSDFDQASQSVFWAVFVLYHLYFLVKSAWKRHKESQKLYMDSEQLEKIVEEKKHQFKLAWARDDQMKFTGDSERLASFVDVDPILQVDDEELAQTTSFCRFVCISSWRAFLSVVTCRCFKNCFKNTTKMRAEHTRLRTEHNIKRQESNS